MATSSVSYSFVNGTTADASQVNQNFTDVVNFLNNSVVHKDGSVTMTGALTLPASDPTSANQATRKSYVDAQSVRVFASTAARDAAIAVPTAGMVCYIDAGDATEGLWSYNGTSWRQRNWNEPWGYLTTITGASAGALARGGASSASLNLISGSYTHVNNRRVRVSAFAGARWTNSLGHAYRLSAGGTSLTYLFAGGDQTGHAHLGIHTASGSSTTYTVAVEFAASVTDVYHAAVAPWIVLEDIGPAGAPV